LILPWGDLTALATVLVIDVALAGDNAVVVGMAAAGLPQSLRRRAIVIGFAAAAAMRIAMAGFAMHLLALIGLVAAGGLLLLWVAWKFWRELRSTNPAADDEAKGMAPATKTLRQAVTQILVADVSMSLDNVLAVAGAARNKLWVLIVGLALSVIFTGLAASLLARIIRGHRWIAYCGLGVVVYVALSMIWDGSRQIARALS
jgi:YjbE family integral membrane protein